VDEATEADVLDTIEKVNKPDVEKENNDFGDELLPDAIELVVDQGAASVSMLQRRFRIGYNRAARIIDMMEDRQIVGPPDGSRPRQVLISKEDLENMKNTTLDM
jgi:S-DNA-T family DNA segregation ATPase FtsK/SpoIIIE